MNNKSVDFVCCFAISFTTVQEQTDLLQGVLNVHVSFI